MLHLVEQAAVVLFGIEDERNAKWIKKKSLNQIKINFLQLPSKLKTMEGLVQLLYILSLETCRTTIEILDVYSNIYV
ncbi:hypothetical protein PMI05_05472 [Brevibacillus sp. BC25]|nr:hypothetical protein PMI05_05472 [Brevibacillus sp. BC25]